MDETEQIEGKIAIYINKMQIPFLLDHLAEIMRKTKNLNLLKTILKELMQKINKSKKSEYKKKIITLINL
jgi:predicted TIM-barrel fold metal-dependent hydrolase